MLSRVDGVSSYEQLCVVTGLGFARTFEVLRKLKRDAFILGARDGNPVRPQAGASLLERLDDGSPVDPALLSGGPDLAPELKMRLVRVHRRLANLSPHELLGVSPGTAGGALKRAYFVASKECHPDRFYRKDIGPFRAILGEIFTHLSRAFRLLQTDSDAAQKK